MSKKRKLDEILDEGGIQSVKRRWREMIEEIAARMIKNDKAFNRHLRNELWTREQSRDHATEVFKNRMRKALSKLILREFMEYEYMYLEGFRFIALPNENQDES